MTSRRQRNDGVMGREAEPGGAVRTGKEGSTAPHHEHELYRADRGSSCRPSRREVGLGVPRRPAPASFRASTHHRETPPLALPGDDPSSSVVRRTARRPLSRVSSASPGPKKNKFPRDFRSRSAGGQLGGVGNRAKPTRARRAGSRGERPRTGLEGLGWWDLR